MSFCDGCYYCPGPRLQSLDDPIGGERDGEGVTQFIGHVTTLVIMIGFTLKSLEAMRAGLSMVDTLGKGEGEKIVRLFFRIFNPWVIFRVLLGYKR